MIFNSKNLGYGVYNISQQQFIIFYPNTIGLEITSLGWLSSYGYEFMTHFSIYGVYFVNTYLPDVGQNVVSVGVLEYG